MQKQLPTAVLFAFVMLASLLWPKEVESKSLTVFDQVVQEFGAPSIMVRVAIAESGLVATAKNPNSTASGVFQILKGTWKDYGCVGEVFDPVDNIKCARKIYDREGTRPWNASKSKWSQSL